MEGGEGTIACDERAVPQRLGITLVVTTYQSGRLILLRAEETGQLNTHFRMFRSPMGGDYRNQPALTARLDPPGKHDACYVPRRIHVGRAERHADRVEREGGRPPREEA